MRGEKEGRALNHVRRFLFCDKLQQPIVFWDKSVYDISDKEFMSDYACYCNFGLKSFYGLTADDMPVVLNALRTAQENPDASEFPDFIFSNGLIEHFQITASKQTKKKGSEEKISDQKFKKSMNEELQEYYNYCNENPSFDQIRSKSWTRDNMPDYSYTYLCQSFKNNLEKHLKSLNKYNGCKDMTIFLIENDEVNIEMCETLGQINGEMRCDYPVRQEHFIRYMLSRDKDMLEYLYTFREFIDYVIYYYEEGFEIIKIESMPELLKYIPHKYIMEPRKIKMTHRVVNITRKLQ